MDGNLQARQEVPVESDEMWHLAVCCLLTVFGEVFVMEIETRLEV